LTNDEFKQFLGTRNSEKTELKIDLLTDSAISLPDSIDWRTKKPNVLTKVKNQAQCGSCWAFSAVETVESREVLLGKPLKVLSEQALVDCEHLGTPSDQGCGGGEMSNAFTWMVQKGA